MQTELSAIVGIATGPCLILNVEVRRSPKSANQYIWVVLDGDGKLIEVAPHPYSTREEALHHGKAAVRNIIWKALDIMPGRMITYRAPLLAPAQAA